MVRHHHAVEADFFIDAHCFQHIDIPVVDERLLEVEKTSANVSEMHIEDFLAAAEVADHVVDFLSRLLQHLRDGPLAKIQSVVWILFDRYESLEAVNRAEDSFNAS